MGIPDLTVDGVVQAGGIQVLFGSDQGFVAGPLITQGEGGPLGHPETSGHFGSSIAEMASLPDGMDVAAGAPGASVTIGSTSIAQAGEVLNFDLLASGDVDQSAAVNVQTMPSPQAGAHYGYLTSGDITTAPDAHHGNRTETGYVQIDDSQFYGQYAGDRLGMSLDWRGPASFDADDLFGVFIGAPGRTVGSRHNAGAVEQFNWSPDDSWGRYVRTVTAATPGVPGRAATNARFGASVSSAGSATSTALHADVAIGVPGQRIGHERAAGAVDVERFSQGDQSGFSGRGWSTIDETTPGVPGRPGRSANFGAAVSAYALTDSDSSPLRLAIGIPFQRNKARSPVGAVELFKLHYAGASHKHVAELHRVGGGRAHDRFGEWLSAPWA